MTRPLITDHVYRPVYPTTPKLTATPVRQRPCAYMNCRRSQGEHQRSIAALAAR